MATLRISQRFISVPRTFLWMMLFTIKSPLFEFNASVLLFITVIGVVKLKIFKLVVHPLQYIIMLSLKSATYSISLFDIFCDIFLKTIICFTMVQIWIIFLCSLLSNDKMLPCVSELFGNITVMWLFQNQSFSFTICIIQQIIGNLRSFFYIIKFFCWFELKPESETVKQHITSQLKT